MNTCCENTTTDVTTPETSTREITFVQPHWRARRHEGGVDVEVVIPGVKKDSLTLEIQGTQLVLEAVRPADDHPGKLVHGPAAPEGYRLKLRIAENLDTAKLTAALADGILKLSLPLVEAAQPKRIEVL